jgi:hypothetical protein
MVIRLNERETIEAMIKKVQYRCNVRLHSYDALIADVNAWERRAFNPSKSALRGCKLISQASGEKVAKRYNGIPMETVINLEHDTVGWLVVSVERVPVKAHDWTVTVEPSESVASWVVYKACRL